MMKSGKNRTQKTAGMRHPAMTVMRLSQRSSIPLDDKNCLIVNTIFLANLSQTIISF